MAKQKTIFDRIARKVKRDSGTAWNKEWIGVLLAANSSAGPIPNDALSLQDEDFLRTVQLEIKMSDFDELMRVESNEEAIVYPGLMAAWESKPTTVELDRNAVIFAMGNRDEILRTALDRVRRLFPACLLLDIRQFGLSLFNCNCDGLFIYPSYNEDRGYPLLLALAVDAKKGLEYPITSRIVLAGDTFGDALDITEKEREITRRRCLGGFDNSRTSLVWSPMDDEPKISDIAALTLALMCSDHTVVETLPGEKVRRLHVRLANDGSDAAAAAVEVTDANDTAVDETAPDSDEPPESATAPVDTPSSPSSTGSPSPEAASADGPSPIDCSTPQPTDEIAKLRTKVAELEAALAGYEQKTSTLDFHLRQAQTTAADSKAKVAALQKRAELVEHMDIPSTPLEALQLAEEAFADRLVFTDAARRSAAEFTKGSPREVWAVLRSMATMLHPLIFGKTEGNIVYEFEARSGFELTLREMKQIKRNEALSKLRTITYHGRTVDIGAHVKGRGSKRGETLRVHFFVDDDKIVIAHCGEHLPTYDTSSL